MFNFKQKYLCVLFVVMMFFVIASGGCGGGSSNSSTYSNPNNPSPDNPSPDNPTPNNPETEYDVSVLAGTWKASTGTCTFTDPTGTFTLVPGDEGINFSFSDIQQVNDDSANIVMEADIHWKGGTNISGRFSRNSRTFHHIGVNVWRWVVNDPDADDTITITITSPTTLEVEESSTNAEQHQIYSARYTLVKQDSTREYDIVSTLAGTWIASDGTATQRDDNENFDLVMLEDGGSLKFSNIQLNGDTASIDITGETNWEYLNGSCRGSTSHRNYYVDHPREFQHIGVNIWQAWYKGVDDHKYTITITSPTTATFEEAINDPTYGWTTYFTITKQATF